jgi:hypothetical protein
MTDTAAPQLTSAMCDLADAQYGMITSVQAHLAGVPDLPAGLVQAGLAEEVAEGVIRLKAGAHHPHPTAYAAWLTLRAPHGVADTSDLDLQRTGIASHSTALVIYGLIAPYSPVWEFTAWGYDDEDEEESAEIDHRVEPDEPRIYWRSQVPHWTLVDGIPTTTPAQTLLDLSGRLNTAQLRELAAGFVKQHHFDSAQLRKDLLALCVAHAESNGFELEERHRERPWTIPAPALGSENAFSWTNSVADDWLTPL